MWPDQPLPAPKQHFQLLSAPSQEQKPSICFQLLLHWENRDKSCFPEAFSLLLPLYTRFPAQLKPPMQKTLLSGGRQACCLWHSRLEVRFSHSLYGTKADPLQEMTPSFCLPVHMERYWLAHF